MDSINESAEKPQTEAQQPDNAPAQQEKPADVKLAELQSLFDEREQSVKEMKHELQELVDKFRSNVSYTFVIRFENILNK